MNTVAKFFGLLIFCFVSASAKESEKVSCAQQLRKSVACLVGQEPLESCRNCKSMAQVIALCNKKELFESEAHLKGAAMAESEAQKDASVVSLAIASPNDSLVMRKAFLRCTQRLVEAQECELQNGKDCEGVSSCGEIIQECRPYFEGKFANFYNEMIQYRMAKEYAANKEDAALVIVLKLKEDDAWWTASLKSAAIPVGIFSFFWAAPLILNQSSKGRY
jgi:hypothetical protein